MTRNAFVPAEEDRDDEGNDVSKNEKRSNIRKLTGINESTRKSLQKISGLDNLNLINILMKKHGKETSRYRKLLGLRAILEELLAPMYQVCPSGIMLFQDAYDIFSSFGNSIPKTEFRDELLSPDGLCVVVHEFNMTRYIILDDTEKMDLPGILAVMHRQEPEITNRNCDLFRLAFNSIETEYDRWITKLLLCDGKTRQEILDFGFKPDRIVVLMRNMKERLVDWEHALEKAEELTHQGYIEKKAKLGKRIEAAEKKLRFVRGTWTDARIGDLEESIEMMKESLASINIKILREDKKDKRHFRMAVKRTAGRLAAEERIKRRKLGGGRKQELDSEEEEWLVKCIEDKTTIHGRRHEPVVYTNHRVKNKDLLKIVNFKRREKGKRPLRSVSSVHSRARPSNKRSVQAKRHLGKGLWCSKKPPKTEDNGNECTHHQRKHVQMAKEEFFSSEYEHKSNVISTDDKAFLRPGTSEGAKGARNQVILQPSNDEIARKLPIHDFPESKMYITPSAFRFIRKKRDTVDGRATLVTEEDESVVVVHPKAYVNTTATTWASNTIRLRWELPHLFESEESTHSGTFRGLCARLKAVCMYYIDTTTETDMNAVTSSTDCHHKAYEILRLSMLEKSLAKIDETYDINALDSFEKHQVEELMGIVAVGPKESIQELKENIKSAVGQELKYFIKSLCSSLNTVLQKIQLFDLPAMYTYILELTDAGPGVGVSHAEVRFRVLEVARLHSLEKVLRLHRAREDSGQNEAERLNACVGDALCDGGALQWQKHNAYEGLGENDLANMSLDELNAHKEKMMEKYAWAVAKDVCLRIVDSPAPRGYTSAFVVEDCSEFLLFNMEFMRQYLDAADSKKASVPGYGYFTKLQEFEDTHCEMGELYFEFHHSSCKEIQESLCDFCSTNTVTAPPKPTRHPYPDYSRLPKYHYKSWADTPTEGHSPDDFQPRAQIKDLFGKGELKISDLDAIKSFARKYIVSEKLVSEYLRHITLIKTRKEKRLAQEKTKRQARARLTYTDINWKELYETNKLASLLVRELKLYLEHHGIAEGKYKQDNIRIIKAHIGSKVFDEMVPEQNSSGQHSILDHNRDTIDDSCDSISEMDLDSDDSEDDSSSSEDEIMAVIGASSSSSEESFAEEDDNDDHLPTSRYGRRCADFRQEGCISWDNILLDTPR